MLSASFSWSIRLRATSISLSRPKILELREASRVFFDLDFLVGERQFSSRSRAAILLRSWSFSNSRSSTRSSEEGLGSS